METKKNNAFLTINRVNERKDCYRLTLSDGTKLDLSFDELNGFVPQSKDTIRLTYYDNLIISDVIINEKTVIRRSHNKMASLLEEMRSKLLTDYKEAQRISVLELTDDFDRLPEVFRHRIRLHRLVMKQDFTAKTMEQQIIVCTVAKYLSRQSDSFIAAMNREVGKTIDDYAKIVQLTDLEIHDAKALAYCYRKDRKKRLATVQDFKASEILNYKGQSMPYSLRTEDAIQRYVKTLLIG